jgi:hypothetical protein
MTWSLQSESHFDAFTNECHLPRIFFFLFKHVYQNTEKITKDKARLQYTGTHFCNGIFRKIEHAQKAMSALGIILNLQKITSEVYSTVYLVCATICQHNYGAATAEPHC